MTSKMVTLSVLLCGLLAVLLTLHPVRGDEVEDPRKPDPPVNSKQKGGWSKQDVTSEGVKQMTQFGLDQINAERNSATLVKLGAISSARSQIVAGIKYNIVFDKHETNCPRTAADASKCTPTSRELCRIVGTDQAWVTPRRKLLGYKCVPGSTPSPDNTAV